MTTDNKKDEIDQFTSDAPVSELASWSLDADAEKKEDEEIGEVEFFSLPETEKKGAKRFSSSSSKKGKKSPHLENLKSGLGEGASETDTELLELRAEMEAELTQAKLLTEEEDFTDKGENDSDSAGALAKASDWNDEPDDELPTSIDPETDLDIEGNFEADMLLVEAHDELERELSEKSENGEAAPDSSIVEEEDLPELVLNAQSEEDLQVDEAFEESQQTLEDKSPYSEPMTLMSKVEAILFAAPRPLKVGEILEVLGEEATSKDVSEAISSIVAFYRGRSGGFALEAVRGGYQFQSNPQASPYMQRMFSSRPRPISRAAQETLAIIAYRQPVTRADIEFIRGVDAGSIVKNLLDRDLIKAVGRKEDAGRPILFGTTDEFLQIYGLQSLAELPPLESFQPANDMVKAGMDIIEQQDIVVHDGDFVGDYDGDASQKVEGESEQEVAESLAGGEVTDLHSNEADVENLEANENTTESGFGGASQYDLEQNSVMTSQESEEEGFIASCSESDDIAEK